MNKVIKALIYAVSLYICLIMQTTLAGYIAIEGVTPDFLLLFTLCIAFEVEGFGIVMAAINGFCMDMLSVHSVNGLYMIMYPCLAFMVDIFRKAAQGIWKYLWLFMCIVVASLICETMSCLFVTEGLPQLVDMISKRVFPRTLYTMAVVSPYVVARTIIVGVQDNRRKRSKTIY